MKKISFNGIETETDLWNLLFFRQPFAGRENDKLVFNPGPGVRIELSLGKGAPEERVHDIRDPRIMLPYRIWYQYTDLGTVPPMLEMFRGSEELFQAFQLAAHIAGTSKRMVSIHESWVASEARGGKPSYYVSKVKDGYEEWNKLLGGSNRVDDTFLVVHPGGNVAKVYILDGMLLDE